VKELRPLARVVALHLEPRFPGLRWRQSACDCSIAGCCNFSGTRTVRTSPLRAQSAQHVILEVADLVDTVADRAAAASGLGDPNADRGAVRIHLFAVERDMTIGSGGTSPTRMRSSRATGRRDQAVPRSQRGGRGARYWIRARNYRLRP
jgi:hypothetical protein